MRKVFLFTLAVAATVACGSGETPSAAPPASNPTQTVPNQPVVPPATAGAGSPAQHPMMMMQPVDMQQPTPAGSAGTSAAPPGAGSAAAPMAGTTGAVATGPMQHTPGECGLKTKYAGDENCILPPPSDKGFQMHIGPSNYDNPEPMYLLRPGAEPTTTFTTMSTNTEERYFYYREYRMRLGAHHNIITSGGAGDSGLGQRIGTVNNLISDYPVGGLIAPENKGVGIKIKPKTSISVQLHSLNTTEETQLREVWVNFWYRTAEEVTDPVNEVFAVAPMGAIPPGADVKTNGSCTVSGNGRMLWMYGHRHASTVSFTVWRNRGGMKDLVYQGYNYDEPLVLDYSSTVKNATPGAAPQEGGWSGILDTKSGDTFTWECHVINKGTSTLLFTNNTFTGEMCILDAEMVGSSCK